MRVFNVRESAAVNMFSGVTATLTLPPAATNIAPCPIGWRTGPDCPAHVDLELWAAGTVDLTDATLYTARPKIITIADDDVDTVDFANNELDITTHSYQHGDGPLTIATSGVLPAGLSATTQYWAIYVSSGAIQFALSLDDALAGTAVAFTDGGSGTHTISDVVTSGDETKRLRWMSMGLLGPGQYGLVSLLAQQGYMVYADHSPRNVAYALTGAWSASVAVSATLYPRWNA
jgi:hypothetical protein